MTKNHLCSESASATKARLQCRCSHGLVLIPVHDAGTKEQLVASVVDEIQHLHAATFATATFAMSVISRLPAVSACSSRSPSSQVGTSLLRRRRSDRFRTILRLRRRSSQESSLIFGKEIVFLVLSGKKISPAAPGKLALRAAARSVVTNLGFHCGASSCAHFSDNDSAGAKSRASHRILLS